MAPTADHDWVLLAYRLPREPSTPRITLWRNLRRLGAVQVIDGLAALPANPTTVEAFDWLAEAVLDAGGEAWTWQGRPGTKAQGRVLRERMAAEVAAEYKALVEEAKEADHPTNRTVERLRRELRRIGERDHVHPKEREQARRAVEAVGKAAAR